MKVALADRYRMWMLVLLPATAGVGTLLLWARTLKWPLSIDDHGVTLRDHRRVEWNSIKKIGVSRSYVDGHCSQVRIHHAAGTCKIPLDALRNGQAVLSTMLAMFGRAHLTSVDPVARSVGNDPELTNLAPSARRSVGKILQDGYSHLTARGRRCIERVGEKGESRVIGGGMSAVVESAPKIESATSSEASSTKALKFVFADWWPVAAVAVGSLLSVVWAAGLVGLSVLALWSLV